jgi:hypothetical protein
MIRRRFVAGALCLGLGLVGGCSTSECGGGLCSGGGVGGFFSRFSLRSRPVMTTEAPCCDGGGPMLGDPGQVYGSGPVVAPPVQTVPPGTALPPLAPAPRLVPQAQPEAANPTSSTKAVAR